MCCCRRRCHHRRPNASNDAASAMFPTPMPKCEPALCEIYTALRIPPPRPRPPCSERRCEGRALPAWPRPRRARPRAALCAPAQARGPNAERSERGEGLRVRPHLGRGRGQSASTVPTWGGPRLQKLPATHRSSTPPVRPLHHSCYRSSGAAGPVPGAAGRLGAEGGCGGLRAEELTAHPQLPRREVWKGEGGAKQFSSCKKLFGCFVSQNLKHYVRHICSIIKSVVPICLATHSNVFTFPLNFFFICLNNISPLPMFSFFYGKYYSSWLQDC